MIDDDSIYMHIYIYAYMIAVIADAKGCQGPRQGQRQWWLRPCGATATPLLSWLCHQELEWTLPAVKPMGRTACNPACICNLVIYYKLLWYVYFLCFNHTTWYNLPVRPSTALASQWKTLATKFTGAHVLASPLHPLAYNIDLRKQEKNEN